ncbi:hypothetical protein ACHWQZ_G000552 [Mnemiopsis leidyi]
MKCQTSVSLFTPLFIIIAVNKAGCYLICDYDFYNSSHTNTILDPAQSFYTLQEAKYRCDANSPPQSQTVCPLRRKEDLPATCPLGFLLEKETNISIASLRCAG